MILRILTALSCCLLLYVAGCSRSQNREDPVTEVQGHDAEMNAAIKMARSRLPEFWKTFEHPARGETDFALKLKIADPNGVEHFWVTPIQRKGGKIYGTISNEPVTVRSVKSGQRIEIPEAQIIDWLYMRNDKMVGNFTLRVLLKRTPEEEAAKYRAMLAEP